ncbi:hypothetical protein JMJ35_002855 [Cladonia borealis]|uniref:Uncharacterized protein n=1 Tax=Cladonia borealis TaxID=184061 RepID=A0AA39R6J2_9LECA|nr:hypothetical protein JMJ35_002855 [Cladonia borealis]
MSNNNNTNEMNRLHDANQKHRSLGKGSQHSHGSNRATQGSHRSTPDNTNCNTNVSGSTKGSSWAMDSWLSQAPGDEPWTPFSSRKS